MPAAVNTPGSLRQTSDLLRQRVANLAFRRVGHPTKISIMPREAPHKFYRTLKAIEARAWPQPVQAEVNCVGVWEIKTFDDLIWLGVEDGEPFTMRVSWRAGTIVGRNTTLQALCSSGQLRQAAAQRDVAKLTKLTGLASATYGELMGLSRHLDRMSHFVGELRARGVWRFEGTIVRAADWQPRMTAWREEVRGVTYEQLARGPDPLTRVLPAPWGSTCPRCNKTAYVPREACALCN